MRSITQLGWVVPLLLTTALSVACSSGSTPPPETAAAAPAADAEPSAAPAESPEPASTDEAAADPAIAEYEAETAQGSPPSEGGAGVSDGETRTMQVIQKVVLDNRARFRACYDAVQAKEPEVQGDIAIFFVLSSEGRVREASLNEQRSTLKHPEVAKCIIGELRKVQFPASSKGLETKVTYPFNFNPK